MALINDLLLYFIFCYYSISKQYRQEFIIRLELSTWRNMMNKEEFLLFLKEIAKEKKNKIVVLTDILKVLNEALPQNAVKNLIEDKKIEIVFLEKNVNGKIKGIKILEEKQINQT